MVGGGAGYSSYEELPSDGQRACQGSSLCSQEDGASGDQWKIYDIYHIWHAAVLCVLSSCIVSQRA